MSELTASTDLAPLPRASTGGGSGRILQQIRGLAAQPAVAKSLPAIGFIALIGLAAMIWMVMSAPPSRTLFGSLPDEEKAAVVEALGAAGVPYELDRTTAALGADFTVLEDVPVEDIGRVNPLRGEAVGRLRAGTVIRQAGYDGEYGVIRLFEDGELDRLSRGDLLFDAPVHRRVRAKSQSAPEVAEAQGWKAKHAFMLLRVGSTGRKASPPLFETMAVLGKEVTRRRLRRVAELLATMKPVAKADAAAANASDGSSASTAHAACNVIEREPSVSTSASASRCCTAW